MNVTTRKARWITALGLTVLIAAVAVITVSAQATVLFEDNFDGSIDSTKWPDNESDNFTYDGSESHSDDGTGSAYADQGNSNEILSKAFDTSDCGGGSGDFVVQFYYKLAGTTGSTDIDVWYGSDGTDACYGVEDDGDCLDPTGGSWALYKDVVEESKWKQDDFKIGFDADLDGGSDQFWVDDVVVYCCSSTEVCDNGLDDDCDCSIDGDDDDCQCVDDDSDGYDTCDSSNPNDTDGEPADCDDGNSAVNPGATEDCDNNTDDDCDGDEDCADADCQCADGDSDGYDTCEASHPCDDDNPADCDDDDPDNFPGNTEVCDGQDNDCDGLVDCDDPDMADDDNDGVCVCDDCDDNEPDNFPGNTEDCEDGIDNDCDDLVDEEDPDCAPVGGATAAPMLGTALPWIGLAALLIAGAAAGLVWKRERQLG
jgi:hypothetical protein